MFGLGKKTTPHYYNIGVTPDGRIYEIGPGQYAQPPSQFDNGTRWRQVGVALNVIQPAINPQIGPPGGVAVQTRATNWSLVGGNPPLGALVPLGS